MKNATVMDNEVHLYVGDHIFGVIDTSGHSESYATDIVENWQNGILKEDNPSIKKFLAG